MNDDDPVFFRPKGGKVHIFKERRSPFHILGQRPSDGFAETLVDVITARNKALCGAIGSEFACGDYTSVFPDEDLCAVCRRLFKGDPEALYRHQQFAEEPMGTRSLEEKQ